jgi:hypothetical protein
LLAIANVPSTSNTHNIKHTILLAIANVPSTSNSHNTVLPF